MKHSLLLTALAVFALSSSASAREKDGVTMPDTMTVEGKTLNLNGMGTRTKFIFKVYVAALYLETATKDAAQVISSDQSKRVAMVMLRDLERKAIVDAVKEGFQKNAGDKMATLQPKLDQFLALIKSDFKKGDKFIVTYVPGKGTMLSGAGEKETIAGKDFADALFSVWLGKSPVDDGLKKEMLGQP